MCMSHLFKASYNFCLMKPFQSIWTADDSHNFKFPSTEFYHHVLAQLSLCLCDFFFSFFYPHSKRMCTSSVSLLLKISFWSCTRKVENARLWDLWTIINHFSRELHFLKNTWLLWSQEKDSLGWSESQKRNACPYPFPSYLRLLILKLVTSFKISPLCFKHSNRWIY